MQKIDEISIRIKSMRETLGLNQEEFAQKVGVSRSIIANIETGVSKPKYPDLVKIATVGRVTLDWLITGEEASFTPPMTDLRAIKGSEAKPAAAEFYPLIDKVTAGDFAANAYADNIVEYYPVNFVRKNCFLVEVEGESMTHQDPDLSLSPGDLLLVDPMETVTPGDLVIVKLTSTRHMVKQFFRTKDGIELRSYNPSHPTIYISDDQLEYIFRVVYHQPRGRRR